MIKAGALLYAMFLVIVVSIISSSFILINYYNNTYIINSLKQEQLFQNVNSGINYGLAQHQEIPLNETVVIDLFNDEQNQITLFKKNWGAFYVLTAQAKWKNKSAVKSTLIGENINEGEKIALYLSDQNKPLSLTGKTQLIGDCYLPKSGIKRAYVEGKSFVGNKLINGLKFNSQSSLPPINKKLIDANQLYFTDINNFNDSIISYELIMDQDTIINSFQNKTLVIYSPFPITLSNKLIEGNIIIKSDHEITIKPSAILTGVVLYAKGIVVKEKTKSSLQLFAQDSIVIEENCELLYPSIVALIPKKNRTVSPKITIGKEAIIKGSIFITTESADRQYESVISLGEKSEVTGQVYASEVLELKGEVYGGVFCKKLLLKTPSSVYENHLMDVIINRDKLPKQYVGAALTQETKHQRIIQWLN